AHLTRGDRVLNRSQHIFFSQDFDSGIVNLEKVQRLTPKPSQAVIDRLTKTWACVRFGDGYFGGYERPLLHLGQRSTDDGFAVARGGRRIQQIDSQIEGRVDEPDG